jgi:hypothetical protein
LQCFGSALALCGYLPSQGKGFRKEKELSFQKSRRLFWLRLPVRYTLKYLNTVPVFRIRIGYMRIRIRIQHFRRMRIRIQCGYGFWKIWSKFSKGKLNEIFFPSNFSHIKQFKTKFFA